MKKQSNIKQSSTEKKQAAAIEKALRSNGYLFPLSEDEIMSLDKIIGSTAIELPESLKDPSFLFSKSKTEAKVIPIVTAECEELYTQAYAARDGQDSISADTSAKMDEDIKNLKAKRKKKK